MCLCVCGGGGVCVRAFLRACVRACVCALNQSEGGVVEFIDFWNIIVDAISFMILAGMLFGSWYLFGF